MAAGYTGKNLYLIFGGTVLDTVYRSFSPTETMSTVDQSAGADAAVTRLTTLKDGRATLDYRTEAGTAGTALWAGLDVGSEGTLEWGPEGTATNAPRGWVNAILVNKSPSFTYNDVVMFRLEWEYDGELTETTY